MQHQVKIKSITKVTGDVLKIVTEKPALYKFNPGQATEITLNVDGWNDARRPFTFTSIPANDYLEFTIKTYAGHKGVTNELLKLKPEDEINLHDVFGDIEYKNEGTFIAGGAGVTPFISILRYLNSRNEISNNKLIFANKTKSDIIYETELQEMLGSNFINILSEEKSNEYAFGKINEDFIKSNSGSLNQMFYVCGPPPMMQAVLKQLQNLGVSKTAIITETF
ncbi:MAG: flavodoxin reductase [Bacteroidetes bacterium]|nr:flavodoxin reductase [Bacteroidota bacterium]MBL0052564.1 flavodoxin reductase [Bacteroidota bacterium]